MIGNDAGDADSIISAITLAYIESTYNNKNQLTPVVSISQNALAHERPDVNLLLQLAGIRDSSGMLLFIEDLLDMLMSIKDAEQSRAITLVDHNTINKSLRNYKQELTITDIVDHHNDEGLFMDTCSGNHRTIAFEHDRALVASTTTLVAEILRRYYPSPYPSSLAILLLGEYYLTLSTWMNL